MSIILHVLIILGVAILFLIGILWKESKIDMA